MRIFQCTLLLLLFFLMGACATIQAGPTTQEPGWFVADSWGSDDILYCYPPHYKVERFAGKCFDIY